MAVFKRPAPPATPTATATISSPSVSKPAPPARPKALIASSPRGTQTVAPPPPIPVTTTPAGRRRVAPPPAPAPERETINEAIQGLPKTEDMEPQEKPRFREGRDEAEGQITLNALRNMSLTEKHELWKKLNKRYDNTSFVPLLRLGEVPKRMVKEYPPETKPAIPGAMWCCYCGDWTIYESFAYVGSDKCIGCSISTKDYYNRSANKLWKVDL